MRIDKPIKTRPFTLLARKRSFRYAWDGIRRFFSEEHNARIHLFSTVIVILFASVLHVSGQEIVLLIIVTGFVWVAEIFNTAIEKIIDFVEPRYHPAVKSIKDLAAAGVLIAACIALLTGAFIFIPKLF